MLTAGYCGFVIADLFCSDLYKNTVHEIDLGGIFSVVKHIHYFIDGKANFLRHFTARDMIFALDDCHVMVTTTFLDANSWAGELSHQHLKIECWIQFWELSFGSWQFLGVSKKHEDPSKFS